MPRSPKGIRFSDVEALLGHEGFVLFNSRAITTRVVGR